MNESAATAREYSRPFPLADLLGIQFVIEADGRAVAEFQPRPEHANPMGTLHGGVLCDLADAAMGVAFTSTLKPGESFTTLELKINFLRPVWQEALRAEAEIISRGRTVGMVGCKVTDAKGRLMASASSTCLVLSGEAAENR